MIILLDTSTPVCHLSLIDGEMRRDSDWDAGRGLAKGLLSFLETELKVTQSTWSDISGIGVFQGPGSFTGLRIGMTVMNTLAGSLSIPIVGAQGDNWQRDALSRLENKDNDQVVLPFYGGEANITKPRK
jgi:tRNA threonylcarbamoyl adenosine modification protein YeaZ